MPGGISIQNFGDNRVPNSPRTLEACARQGIDPHELVFKPLNDFREAGLESWTVQMRFDHAEHKRQEKVKAIQREWKQVEGGAGTRKSTKGTDLSFIGGDDATASTVRREQMQMEKMKRRQQQEIEQMISHEIRMKEMQDDMQEKERKEAARHQAHLNDVARRKKEFEQRKKDFEEKKRQEEIKEQQQAAANAAAEFKREQKRQAMLAAKAQADAKEARRLEIERRQKQEEHKAETERILAEQQAEIERKRKLMEEKEAMRTAAIEEEHRQTALARQRKSAEIKARMEAAQESQAEILAAQKAEFAEKERLANLRREEWERERDAQYKENRRKAAQKRQEIEKAFQLANSIEEERKNTLRAKEKATNDRLQALEDFKQQDAKRVRREIEGKQKARRDTKLKADHDLEERTEQMRQEQNAKFGGFEKVMEARNQEILRKREEARLKAMDIQENVERMKKQQEYKKVAAMQKMKDDEAHAAMIAQKREEIKEQRKKLARDSTRARADLAKMMDGMRKGKKMKDPAELMASLGLDSSSSVSQAVQKQPRTTSAPPARPVRAHKVPKESRPTTAKTTNLANSTGGSSRGAVSTNRQQPPPQKTRPQTSTQRKDPPPSRQGGNRLPASATTRAAPARKKAQRGVSAHSSASEGRKKANGAPKIAQRASNLTADEAQHLVEQLRRQQNEDLLLVLEQEQRNETDREIELAKVTDPSERRRLEQLFGVERARASERIMQITAEHEAVLASHMKELNLF